MNDDEYAKWSMIVGTFQAFANIFLIFAIALCWYRRSKT